MLKNNKALGQHWLYNREVLDYIAELAKMGMSAEEATDFGEGSGASNDEEIKTCLEIGPGLGTLTAALLRCFEKVTAVEFDERLARNLPGSFPGKNLEVINADFLKFDLSSVVGPYVIAGNIPYYITSPIIEKILTARNQPKRAVLLMQKEVAERIVSEKETVLSLFCKNYADVYMGMVVKKEEFTPPPKVDSAVLLLEPHAPVVPERVFSVIRLGFAAPRKKLKHNLGLAWPEVDFGRVLDELEISADARPADLKLTDWGKLTEILDKKDR
ncbi:ribosomal RNA small subunit methyltransferase A [Candidatus Saccharibacteria bacterium]|nr:ribosomal RNA small subunit methyltransferase A [Candidatus Saccharibacteria bacterium]